MMDYLVKIRAIERARALGKFDMFSSLSDREKDLIEMTYLDAYTEGFNKALEWKKMEGTKDGFADFYCNNFSVNLDQVSFKLNWKWMLS